MGAVLLGRPKKSKNRNAGPDKPTDFRNVTVRASVEWAEWAERAAEHCRMNLSTAIDKALAKFFASEGFEEPPPRRY